MNPSRMYYIISLGRVQVAGAVVSAHNNAVLPSENTQFCDIVMSEHKKGFKKKKIRMWTLKLVLGDG